MNKRMMKTKKEVDGVYNFKDSGVAMLGIQIYSGMLTPNYTDKNGNLHGAAFGILVDHKSRCSVLYVDTHEHGKLTNTKTIAKLERVVTVPEIGDILREHGLINTPRRVTGFGRKLCATA